MHRDLRMERVRQQAALAVVNGDAGFVAGGFDAEHAHEAIIGAVLRRNISPAMIAGFRNSSQASEGKNYMPSVRVRDNEPFEVAMRRFKRTIEKTGLLTELRAREFYEKPTAERKRKLAAAVKRHYKRLRSNEP